MDAVGKIGSLLWVQFIERRTWFLLYWGLTLVTVLISIVVSTNQNTPQWLILSDHWVGAAFSILMILVIPWVIILTDRAGGSDSHWLSRPVGPVPMALSKVLGIFLFAILPAQIYFWIMMAGLGSWDSSIISLSIESCAELMMYSFMIAIGAALGARLLTGPLFALQLTVLLQVAYVIAVALIRPDYADAWKVGTPSASSYALGAFYLMPLPLTVIAVWIYRWRRFNWKLIGFSMLAIFLTNAFILTGLIKWDRFQLHPQAAEAEITFPEITIANRPIEKLNKNWEIPFDTTVASYKNEYSITVGDFHGDISNSVGDIFPFAYRNWPTHSWTMGAHGKQLAADILGVSTLELMERTGARGYTDRATSSRGRIPDWQKSYQAKQIKGTAQAVAFDYEKLAMIQLVAGTKATWKPTNYIQVREINSGEAHTEVKLYWNSLSKVSSRLDPFQIHRQPNVRFLYALVLPDQDIAYLAESSGGDVTDGYRMNRGTRTLQFDVGLENGANAKIAILRPRFLATKDIDYQLDLSE